MLLELLAYFNIGWTYLQSLTDEGKDALRTWLGPGTSNYILHPTMDVLPESMQRSYVRDDAALLYSESDKRIRPLIPPAQEPSFQRLPWVSVLHKHAETTTDLSEWVSEVRTVRPVPLLQCIRLASRVLNMHLAETSGATVHVMFRNGREAVFEYKGCAELVEEVEKEAKEEKEKKVENQ